MEELMKMDDYEKAIKNIVYSPVFEDFLTILEDGKQSLLTQMLSDDNEKNLLIYKVQIKHFDTIKNVFVTYKMKFDEEKEEKELLKDLPKTIEGQ